MSVGTGTGKSILWQCACGELAIWFYRGTYYCAKHLPEIEIPEDRDPVQQQKFAQATDLLALLERIFRLEETVYRQREGD